MRIRVSIIDDGEGVLSLLNSVLEMRGYEIFSFSKPNLCQIYSFENCTCPKDYSCVDIFIINNNMMNMTGLEFIEKQRRNNCKVDPENKAIISMTYTDTEIQMARRLGCQIFEKLSFIDKIDSWLDECEKRIDPNRRFFNLNLK